MQLEILDLFFYFSGIRENMKEILFQLSEDKNV